MICSRHALYGNFRFVVRPRLVLTLFGIFIGLFLSEVALRMTARWSLQTRYLATAGTPTAPRVYANLEDYLSTRTEHIRPFRPWHNYSANSLGFTDTEFGETKPSGVYRIAALGDSFCYGVVSYPWNVQTLVEQRLTEMCGRPVEVMNFGVPASGVWDYKTMAEFVVARYKPDLVATHFYLGNDAPSLMANYDDIPTFNRRTVHFYLPVFLRNSYLAWRFAARDSREVLKPLKQPRHARADGPPVEGVSPYTRDGFLRVMGDELGRFYSVTATTEKSSKRWSRLAEVMTALVRAVRAGGSKFALISYPSRLQIEERTRANVVTYLKESSASLTPDDFDLDLPSRNIRRICQDEGIDCYDSTQGFRDAGRTGGTGYYLSDDPHWSRAGNALAAELEAAHLAKIVCPG